MQKEIVFSATSFGKEINASIESLTGKSNKAKQISFLCDKIMQCKNFAEIMIELGKYEIEAPASAKPFMMAEAMGDISLLEAKQMLVTFMHFKKNAHMSDEEFKNIRKALLNPETGKSATQTELAELLNCSRDLVAKMESNKTPVQDYIADEMRKLKILGWECKYKFAVLSGNGVNNTHRIEAADIDTANHVFDLELQWSLDNVSMVLLSEESENWENPNYQANESDLYRVELVKIDMDGDILDSIKSSEEYYIGE